MKILILYYSGVGNTKMIATKMLNILNKTHHVDMVSIEKFSSDIDITNYDSLIIGFPTIHSAPAKPILEFVCRMLAFQTLIPAFLFTTCGLYSANTLRVFARKCAERNIIPIMSKSYRCAATDGILIAPYMGVWFKHEKNLEKKVISDIAHYIELLKKPAQITIPPIKLYSILNYPNKLAGRYFLPQIHTHKIACIACGKCMDNCPVKSIYSDSEGYPFANNKSCIHCYRCIHHCPQKALSLSKKHMPVKTLFY